MESPFAKARTGLLVEALAKAGGGPLNRLYFARQYGLLGSLRILGPRTAPFRSFLLRLSFPLLSDTKLAQLETSYRTTLVSSLDT